MCLLSNCWPLKLHWQAFQDGAFYWIIQIFIIETVFKNGCSLSGPYPILHRTIFFVWTQCLWRPVGIFDLVTPKGFESTCKTTRRYSSGANTYWRRTWLLLHGWARSRFTFAWSRDHTTFLYARKTLTTFIFHFFRLIQLHVLLCNEYSAVEKNTCWIGGSSVDLNSEDYSFFLQQSRNQYP